MNKKIILLAILILVISLGLVWGGIYFFSKPNQQPSIQNLPKYPAQPKVAKVKLAAEEKTGKSDTQTSATKEIVQLAFFGDLMLDRSVRTNIEKKGVDWLFSEAGALFSESDFTIANLEGPVADFATKSVGTEVGDPGHFSFVFDKKNLAGLKKQGLNIFNLGNNHILNFGAAGLEQTKVNLAAEGLQYFGEPKNKDSYLVVEKSGVKLGFVSYNQFDQGSADAAIVAIKKLRPQVDWLIVYTHWGVEYKNQPNEDQTNLAHQFIDAGADAIIGSHPHVVQSIEQYKDKYIFYSLGNFIFDQFFSEETKEGLNVRMQLETSQKKIRYDLVPFKMDGSFRIQVLSEEQKNLNLKTLAEISTGSSEKKAMIEKGTLE